MSCTTSSLYKSIEACPGKKTLSGIRRRLYYIPKAHIAAFPVMNTITDAATDMAKLGQLKGDFSLQTEKFWQFIDLKDEASNVTFEGVGEEGSKLYNNQANAIVSGIEDEVKGLANQAINDDLVYLFQQREGKFVLLGNEMFKTHTTPSGDTASEATGAITTTFAIQVYDEAAIPTYVGKIMLDATHYIDAATGQAEVIPQNPG